MISMAAYGENRTELSELKTAARELAARLTEDNWRIEQIGSLWYLRAFLEETPLLDMLLYDVTLPEALDYLRIIRKTYRKSGLLILADKSVSPMAYMKPDIHADTQLLKPWSGKQVLEALEEFIRGYLSAARYAESMAEQFIRCHRGFIVNTLKIRRIALS